MHGDGRAGIARDDADQTFHARNGISNTLSREPRSGRAREHVSQQQWIELVGTRVQPGLCRDWCKFGSSVPCKIQGMLHTL